MEYLSECNPDFFLLQSFLIAEWFTVLAQVQPSAWSFVDSGYIIGLISWVDFHVSSNHGRQQFVKFRGALQDVRLAVSLWGHTWLDHLRLFDNELYILQWALGLVGPV